jgi:hypothetical protein
MPVNIEQSPYYSSLSQLAKGILRGPVTIRLMRFQTEQEI